MSGSVIRLTDDEWAEVCLYLDYWDIRSVAWSCRALLERLEAATALLRASHGLRLISTKVWAESIELTDSVGKQAGGWLKSARNTFSAAPAA